MHKNPLLLQNSLLLLRIWAAQAEDQPVVTEDVASKEAGNPAAGRGAPTASFQPWPVGEAGKVWWETV